METNWLSFSRGTNIDNINNIGIISPFAVEKLTSLNIPIPKTLQPAKKLSVDDLLKAQIVIALDENEHRPLIRNIYPEWEDKIRYWNIKDVYLKKPEVALDELKDHIVELINICNVNKTRN
jgi:protein-tyrosine phosphatase